MPSRGSTNTIGIVVGAAIALVVLVVLLLMLTNGATDFNQGVSACERNGGICSQAGLGCPQLMLPAPTFECSQEEKCCVGLGKKCEDGCDGQCIDGYCYG